MPQRISQKEVEVQQLKIDLRSIEARIREFEYSNQVRGSVAEQTDTAKEHIDNAIRALDEIPSALL